MTPSKEKALQALLTESTKAAAAEAAGISPRTLSNYLHDAEFVNAYREAVDSIIEEVSTQARRMMSPALQVLHEIAEDEDAGNMARIQASRSLLEYGVKLVHEFEYVKRIEEAEGLIRSIEQEREAWI